MNQNYQIKLIERLEYSTFLLKYHYLKRIPNIKYAYGLYDCEELIGVITYGKLSSNSALTALVDEEFKPIVLELNRLCLKYNRKNEASYFVSRTLNLIPKDTIVISYADTGQGHVGTVYKACNFKYYGTTSPKKEIVLPGLETLHSRTAFNYAKKYNLEFEYKIRTKKHRYIYVTGKTQKEFLYSVIKYEENDYPKS